MVVEGYTAFNARKIVAPLLFAIEPCHFEQRTGTITSRSPLRLRPGERESPPMDAQTKRDFLIMAVSTLAMLAVCTIIGFAVFT